MSAHLEHLTAADTQPEWAADPAGGPGPVLILWADLAVVIHGDPAAIRALLLDALQLIPTEG